MSENKENNKTPKWLRILEKESWQAELIISGLALIGTLQLPAFVYWISDTLVNFLPINYYTAGYAISFGLMFGICILTTFFVVHFILRAYWIGLIGLNSAFPQGYKTEDGYYSPIYSRLYASKLPNIKETIKEVDLTCSKMFSGAFAFLLMYGMMSITISVLLGIYIISKDFIPYQLWVVLGIIFFIVTIILLILTSLGKSEKFRNHEKIQKIFFKLSYYFGIATVPFVFKAVNQIIFTFSTHAKNASSNIKIALPFFLLSSCLTMFHIMNSNISHLISVGAGDNLNVHENTIYTTHYLDQYSEDQKIFVPVIDSDIMEGPYVKLFIPILRNESSIQENICGDYQKDKSIDNNEERSIKNQFYLDCYKQYISISLNGVEYDADLKRHRNPQGNREGALCYIPSEIFSNGRNEISVKKIKNKKNEVYDSYTFNFWYSSSN